MVCYTEVGVTVQAAPGHRANMEQLSRVSALIHHHWSNVSPLPHTRPRGSRF